MNIFYDNVDIRLREELNARGLSGVRRNTGDIDFMVSKIANVLVKAYESGKSTSKVVGELGGDNVLTGRYLTTGPSGSLNPNLTYTSQPSILIDPKTNRASNQPGQVLPDKSTLKGPFLTSVEVAIGDHSMGLLNRATVMFTIPNPLRDLDSIEQQFFRPGRYASIDIEYPTSAIVTSGSLLSTGSLPSEEKLKKLYPNLNDPDELTKFSNSVRRMNAFRFEGLITTFEFSYNESGQIDATISLTGTSNVYGDVSMYLPGAEEEKPPTATTTSDITIDPTSTLLIKPTPDPKLSYSGSGQSIFYDLLYQKVNGIINKASGTDTPNFQGCVSYRKDISDVTQTQDDRFIVFGPRYDATTAYNASVTEAYNKNINDAKFLASINPFVPGSNLIQAKSNSAVKSLEKQKEEELKKPAPSSFSRYITLGSLIQFINDYPIQNITGSAERAQIICDYEMCFSNMYPYMVSSIPDAILFLPKQTNTTDDVNSPNKYGNLVYYKDLRDNMSKQSLKDGYDEWPGILSTENDIMFPSRILINMAVIRDIILGTTYDATEKRFIGGIQDSKQSSFTLKSFLSNISTYIYRASGGSINMQLVSHPNNINMLLFADTKFIRSVKKTSDGIVKDVAVTAYSVPMLANHDNGTIVKSFKLTAQLPESAKNLSYVLNQEPSKISELDIAPYMNFMYNTKNADDYNRLLEEYKARHTKAINDVIAARNKYGTAPKIPEYVENLRKNLSTYISYPTSDIRDAQQLTAPIFPFTAEFTLDGINGFKYGDVLTFEALPEKYTKNTVFSVIGVTHTVGSDGKWETAIRTIMRPKIQ